MDCNMHFVVLILNCPFDFPIAKKRVLIKMRIIIEFIRHEMGFNYLLL